MAKKFDVAEKILEKSIDLFYKHGFVKAVCITNSTVYLYFKNKEEILFRIIFTIGEELIKKLQEVMKRREDPVECLWGMISRKICFSTEADNWKKVKIFLEEQYQLPISLKKRTLEQHRQVYDLYYI